MKRAEFLLAFALTVISCYSCELGRSSNGENYPDDTPIVLREQGSFLAGGTVKTQPATWTASAPADGRTLAA